MQEFSVKLRTLKAMGKEKVFSHEQVQVVGVEERKKEGRREGEKEREKEGGREERREGAREGGEGWEDRERKREREVDTIELIIIVGLTLHYLPISV